MTSNHGSADTSALAEAASAVPDMNYIRARLDILWPRLGDIKEKFHRHQPVTYEETEFLILELAAFAEYCGCYQWASTDLAWAQKMLPIAAAEIVSLRRQLEAKPPLSHI